MKERIRILIESQKITKAQLSRDLGVSPVAISKWLNKDNAFGIESLKKLLIRFPNLNARWLILGTGEMFESEAQNENELTTIIDSRVEEILKKYNLTKK